MKESLKEKLDQVPTWHEKKSKKKMSGATSFTEIMESQNRVPSSRTISYFLTSPSSGEMEKLQLKR